MRRHLSSYLSIAFILCACTNRAHEQAMKEWRRNEAVIKAATRGQSFSPDDFLKATEFFEKTTGISMHGNTSTFGLIPDKSSDEDLSLIENWCNRYCQHLRWDESTQSVIVEPMRLLSKRHYY